MLKRIISGSVYVAILLSFFLLRQFVDYRIFHLLVYFFMLVGTYELARATKSVILKGSFVMAIIFAVLFFPIYCLGEYVLFTDYGYLFACYFIALMLIITCIMAFFQNKDISSFFWTALLYVYPALFLLTMFLANDVETNGFIILLMAFVISPISDTFAYFVGSAIGGKKLCPRISPKKTWSGAIGGTIGGVVASLLVYWIFSPTVDFFSPILFFILVGLLASIVNIFGDLFESFIKRKIGIKDIGNIMPGHGGVLDRIDGTTFVVALIYIIFLFV